MKPFEFQTSIAPDAVLKIPPALAAEIDPDKPVRVTLQVPDGDEEVQWAELTQEQFLKGYADSDAIYDNLSEG